MKRLSGLKLLEEREGEGTPANKGDRVLFNIRLFLNKGDEVPLNAKQVEYLPKYRVRVEEGVTYVDHKTILRSSTVKPWTEKHGVRYFERALGALCLSTSEQLH